MVYGWSVSDTADELAGFFLTPAAEKTKTQAENPTSLSSFYKKLKKKLNFTENFLKTEKISGGTTYNSIFVNNYFQFHIIFSTCIDFVWKFTET